MYAAYDYTLSDHILRLQKIEREKDRQSRLHADRRPVAKKRQPSWIRKHEDRVSEFLSVAFAKAMAENF